MKSEALLGVKVNPLNISQLDSEISRAIDSGRKSIIANHNLHSVYLFHKNPEVKNFYSRASHIHVDSMILVMWAKLIGLPIEKEHRVTYVDWINPLMESCERNGWSVYFLGGREEIGKKAALSLLNDYPNLDITTASGYFNFDSVEEALIIETINRKRPNILIVGMGMPRQELWISRSLGKLNVNVILPAGACMDYVAGEVPTPPRWMGRAGLEWLYRLNAEPQRLAKRYIVEPWTLVPWMIRDIKSRKKRQVD